jgi:hypothetical protein
MAPLAEPLQAAASKGIDIVAMRLDVMRDGGWLDLTGSEATLAERLLPRRRGAIATSLFYGQIKQNRSTQLLPAPYGIVCQRKPRLAAQALVPSVII